jgi:hypothetical protein
MMRNERVTQLLLAVIAVFLGMIALRPYTAPPVVRAASAEEEYEVFIEPGTHTLRAPDGRAVQQGKVVVDLTNGNIWGFPTIGAEPYPRGVSTEPPVSKPMYLGKFDFAEMKKRQ